MIVSWIGTQSFGEVDRVDDEKIVTDFFCVIIPVWPQRSYYVHRRGDQLVAESIPLHAPSVALGFARITTWLAAWMFSLAVALAWGRWGWLWPISSGLCALAAALQFALGRLGADEQERRRLLRRVVGIGAPPEILPRPLVDATRVALEGMWRDDHHVSWLDAIARGEACELLAAIAEYHGRPDLAAEVRTRIVLGDAN